MNKVDIKLLLGERQVRSVLLYQLLLLNKCDQICKKLIPIITFSLSIESQRMVQPMFLPRTFKVTELQSGNKKIYLYSDNTENKLLVLKYMIIIYKCGPLLRCN